MPTLLFGILYGLIGGLIGSIIVSIIKIAMKKNLTSESIIADKILGKKNKWYLVQIPLMAIWGAVFGALVMTEIIAIGYFSAVVVSLLAWVVLNAILLPLTSAGIFGLKRDKFVSIHSGIMHMVWAIFVAGTFSLLLSLFG